MNPKVFQLPDDDTWQACSRDFRYCHFWSRCCRFLLDFRYVLFIFCHSSKNRTIIWNYIYICVYTVKAVHIMYCMSVCMSVCLHVYNFHVLHVNTFFIRLCFPEASTTRCSNLTWTMFYLVFGYPRYKSNNQRKQTCSSYAHMTQSHNI